MCVVDADLEAADLLWAVRAVDKLADRVDACDEAVRDARRPSRLDDTVAELRISDPADGDVETQDRLDRPAADDARDRAVAGEPEEAADEPSADVLRNAVVVERTGLHDRVA